jgi:hypothetical protein
VWFASDDPAGSVYTMGRTELKPRMAATNRHIDVPVLGAAPRAAGSTFADGVFTSGSTTFTSATAGFAASDVGRSIFSDAVGGGDVFIASVTNGTTAALSTAATKNATGKTFSLGGSRWPNVAYFGAIDPATGIYYLACLDHQLMDEPTRGSFMILPAWGQRLEMYQSLPPVNGLTRWQVFVYGGYVWHSRYRLPRLTRS